MLTMHPYSPRWGMIHVNYATNILFLAFGRGRIMDKIKKLNHFQQGILSLMTAMALIFAVIYPMTIHRVGFEYKDTILVPSQENGSIVYSGKMNGQSAHFTVSEDKMVTFQYGDKTYGPYTVKEDPTAIPKNKELSGSMTGVEIRQGEEILFRGGVLDTGDSLWLYNEDGTLENLGISYMTDDGVQMDENGNVIDPMEPSAPTILKLINSPELAHKGQWLAWFGAVLICILNALSMLFADELFRWNLSFQIRNAANAEPSDLEIAGRYIGWTVLTIVALVIFVIGLQ